MITCHFCPETVEGVYEAIDADWLPSFWHGDHEVADPVCPRCARFFLNNDHETGEMELSISSEAEALYRQARGLPPVMPS